MAARPQRFARVALPASLLLTGSAGALNIVLDYSHDTYIQTNANAMAALEAAADDIEAVITSTLPARTDLNSVTIGKATASIDWEIRYTNPATGSLISIDPVDIPADEYRVFVGVRPITQPGEPEPTLGRGGVSGIALSNGFSIEPVFQNEIQQAIDDLGTAVAQLETEANVNAGRGGVGPTVGTFNNLDFSGNLGGTNFSFSADVSYGVGVGNLWFDVDTDDNGTFDNNTTLDNYWHWNHTTAPDSGKIDFYSVAVHEILHSLGFGGSDTWDGLINPSDPDEWTGPALIAALGGSGEDAIDVESGAHLAEGLDGVVFGTTTSQEAAMDPSIGSGERKYITNLDAAVLDDINWDIATISAAVEGDYNDSGQVEQGDLDFVLSNWGDTDVSDVLDWTNFAGLPGNSIGGQVEQTELDLVLSNWGDTTVPDFTGSAVPEPAAAVVLLGLAGLGRRRA